MKAQKPHEAVSDVAGGPTGTSEPLPPAQETDEALEAFS